MKRNRFKTSTVPHRSVLLAALLALPLAAAAQNVPASSSTSSVEMSSMPGMDHGSMPGMAMPAMASSVAMSATKTPAKKTSKKPVPQPPTTDSHDMDGMTGMNHSSMPGMDHSAMSAVPTPARPATSATATPAMSGMDHASMQEDRSKQSSSPKPAAGGHEEPKSMDSSAGHGMHPTPPQTTGELQRLDIGAQIGERPVVRGLGLQPMAGDAMQGMPPMQGGGAPPDARSPDYSEGVGDGPLQPHLHGNSAVGMLLLDQLETVHGRDGNSQAWEVQGWYGRDEDKLWLRSEGEVSQGKVEDGNVEALWNHAIATYWGSQLGVRHDFGAGPSRDWVAFGVQGLAPYWFDMEATGYVGSSGRTAARFRADYEVLFTQRLILQPELEFNLYGKDDPARRIGSGLSDVQFGLRLRYEIRREFAPYVGINWVRRVGTTADYARAEGQPVFDQQFVAGFRIWF